MARPRKRVCLEDGLRLDLNELIREQTIVPGRATSQRIYWQYVGSRQLVAWARITADLTDWAYARLRIQMPNLDQTVDLTAEQRNLGGEQWYFHCPALNRRVSVLWKPPGAARFCSRQSWGKQVAYQTQFLDRARRAGIGRQRIRSRLGTDHNESIPWHLPPPKPKWMRWATYERHASRYNGYGTVLRKELEILFARLTPTR